MTTDTSWADVAAATAALLETAYGMREGDQAADSLCAGWTRGHVLTHVARNADAIGNLVTWAVTGVPTPMYASAEAREADIEAGAARPVADLVADVEASAARLAGQTADLAPAHDAVEIELRGGWRIRASELAWRRLREVAYHHVDLDAGFGFADLPPDLTSALLADDDGRGVHGRCRDGIRHWHPRRAARVAGARADRGARHGRRAPPPSERVLR